MDFEDKFPVETYDVEADAVQNSEVMINKFLVRDNEDKWTMIYRFESLIYLYNIYNNILIVRITEKWTYHPPFI